MRVLHTSDWHLGHLLHDLPRDHEHARFLAWLLDLIEAEQVDAHLITGDVFDGGNPSAAAQAAWYGFLAEAHRRRPSLTTVVVAGNHDSPARLTAAAPLYRRVDAHVIGGLPRDAGGAVDHARLVVPLPGPDGQVAAWAVAVPFLRPIDLPDDSPEAVREVHAGALDAARRLRRPGQAIVMMGHLHVTGGQPSWMSERRVLIGGVEAVAAEGLGEGAAYVALGHLHRAQRVGADHVRYAGSPIPLAMGEAGYRHSVVLVDLDGERASAIRTVEVPRAVELLRVPRRGAAPLDAVVGELAGLDDSIDGEEPARRPFLEVQVRLERPEPHLRAVVEQAVTGKRPRLVKITIEHGGDRAALADAPPAPTLAELDEREVLRRRWRREHDGEVPAEVMAAYEQLLAEVREADGGRR